MNRSKWIAAGLCGQCGKHAPAPGRQTCQKCLDYYNARMAQKLTAARQHGVCVLCFAEAADADKKTCRACRLAESRRTGAQRDQRRKDGLCYSCGKCPPVVPRGQCRRCMERRDGYNRARYSNVSNS